MTLSQKEFDSIFDKFLQEVRSLPWHEWKNKIPFTVDTASGWFEESRQRYYTTLSLLPSSVFQAKAGLEIGLGFFTAFMNAKGTSTAATGKDLHIWQVWAKNKGIDARENDLLEGLPFGDDSFEVVYFCEVMEHLLGYPEDYLKDLFRVLKPGGCLILTTPNLHRISNTIRFIMGKNHLVPLLKTCDGVNHVREFDKDELLVYLKNTGFADNNIDIKTFSYYKSLKERAVYQLFNREANRRNILAVCVK